MPNMTFTDIDTATGIVLGGDPKFRDELITFAGVATLLRGCLLARDTVSKKLVPYVKGGSTNGNGIVCAVLTYPVTSTGAGDFKHRVLMKGNVCKNRLVINADGNATNIDGTVIDLLRDVGLMPEDVQSLTGYDQHA